MFFYCVFMNIVFPIMGLTKTKTCSISFGAGFTFTFIDLKDYLHIEAIHLLKMNYTHNYPRV